MSFKPSEHPLVPKHKSDNETAQLAIQAGYPAVEPILDELLEWLKDCNWPVATDLYPFLSSIGAPLAPHIRCILQTDDYTWQYWIFGFFLNSRELYDLFRDDIHRIAASPTEEEKYECLDERCRDAIKWHEPEAWPA